MVEGITDLMDMSLIKLRELVWTGKPGVLQSMGSQKELDMTSDLTTRPRLLVGSQSTGLSSLCCTATSH